MVGWVMAVVMGVLMGVLAARKHAEYLDRLAVARVPRPAGRRLCPQIHFLP